MDLKTYAEVQQDLDVLTRRLVECCGEDVVEKLNENFLISLLRMRLDLLSKLEDLEDEGEKTETLILLIMTIATVAKSIYNLDLVSYTS